MLELKCLLTGETESVPFAVTLDMSGMTSDILSGKCSAAGACRGTPDHIVLTAALKCVFTAVCARCCKPFECSFEHSFEFPVAEKLESDEDEDKFVLMEGASLDVEQICGEQLILNLPLRFLCRKDCKGLCPVCGADLNTGACSCGGKKTDPRLEKLKEYFNK